MHPDSSCVLGIDIGTSGVRTIARDKTGSIVGSASCQFSDLTINSNGSTDYSAGAAYRSPGLWWQGVSRTMQSVIDHVGPEHVCAVAVDGTSGSVLAIDANGTPLASPLMYNDPVDDADILASIARTMPETSAAGGVTSGLAKAMSFVHLAPAAIVHQADWIVGQLSGEYRMTDANNALKTGFDPVAMCWPDWIDKLGPVRPLLPNVAIPGTPVTAISSATAASFGLASTVQLIAGTTDGCASFLATGCHDVGDAVSALGSTLTVKLLSDAPVFAPEFGVYSHRIGDQWLTGGASNTGGAVLSHFFSDAELDALSQTMNTEHPTGLDYYPLLRPGERFPTNDPQFQPRLEPRPDDDQQFLQGLFEGIAAIEHAAYEKLRECGAPQVTSLRSVGGGSANQRFTEIRQRYITARFLPPASDAAAYGTASLAARGADTLGLW